MGLYFAGLPWRSADGAGLYVSDVSLTADPADGHERGETAVEAVYILQATAWCVLKGDLQYIFHPGGGDDPGHAAVADLRAIVTF
jgi:porin